MSDTKDYMLTTYDNPINPFTNFDAWFKEDMRLGHNSCVVLFNEAATSNILSDEINEKDIELAIDELIKREPTIYRKVSIEDYK